jgi:lipopolysaccharide transport system permease protein
MDLVSVLTEKELKVRYKNSILGYFWSIANPLAFALTFYFVFQIIMRFNIPNYALFLICGLFPWQAFANSISTSTNIFISNVSLIKKVSFPRYLLLLSTIFNDIFHFLMSIFVILLFLIFYQNLDTSIIFWIGFIPLNLFAQFLFTFGLALGIASVNVFFRDLERLLAITLNLWFYFTPIFYSENMVPPKFAFILQINPISPIIVNWRNIFMNYTFDWKMWIVSMCYGIILVIIGGSIYKKLNPKFSEAI